MADLRVVSTTDNKPTPEDQERAEKVRKVLQAGTDEYKAVVEVESELRSDMLADLMFADYEQWDENDRRSREDDKRPCVTIWRTSQFVRQVTNAARAANLAIKVLAVDDGADVKIAEVFQGMIRDIEGKSDAPVAYSTACEHQAKMGRGYWRVVSEYEHAKSFVQSLRIKRIRNPFSVYMDPSAQELDGSDARFCLIIEDIPVAVFKRRFPRAKPVDVAAMDSVGNDKDTWYPGGKVRVAERWWIEEVETELLKLEYPNGHEDVVTQAEFDRIPKQVQQPTVVSRRRTLVKTVKHALITGQEILEGNDDLTDGAVWPGEYIPVVPVVGEEVDTNGKVDLRGMIRHAKEPAKIYNYQQSILMETLGTIPRTPYIGIEGQFEGHEGKWRNLHRKAFPYLEIKAVILPNGQLAPHPVRTSASVDVGAIMTAIQQADQDLKASMGLFEPSLGERQSQDQSGVAIRALQKQGEQANSNFLDNLSRAIRFTGRILIDLIPAYYDAPRVIRIIGSDEQEKTVMVHAKSPQAPAKDAPLPEGVEGIYDLSSGRYDVRVSQGPSNETKRAEAFAALSGFIQAYPAAFPILGDLVVGSLDWSGAQAAAERLKKGLPRSSRTTRTRSPRICRQRPPPRCKRSCSRCRPWASNCRTPKRPSPRRRSRWRPRRRSSSSASRPTSAWPR
jgi:hypothetical protein